MRKMKKITPNRNIPEGFTNDWFMKWANNPNFSFDLYWDCNSGWYIEIVTEDGKRQFIPLIQEPKIIYELVEPYHDDVFDISSKPSDLEVCEEWLDDIKKGMPAGKQMYFPLYEVNGNFRYLKSGERRVMCNTFVSANELGFDFSYQNKKLKLDSWSSRIY